MTTSTTPGGPLDALGLAPFTQDLATRLLERFAPLAPDGYLPAAAREIPDTIGAVALEYEHPDGRTHTLRLSRVTGQVYHSETRPGPETLMK